MVQVHTEIEINASPAEVRSVFLNFPKYSNWHTGFLISTLTSKESDADGRDHDGKGDGVQKGDKLTIDIRGTKFNPVVLENSSTAFRWVGSLPYIFTGEHVFRFEPSEKTPGGTRLVQSEEFSGLLSFLVGPTWSFGQNTVKQFEGFNESLKRRVEGSGERGGG